MLRIILTLVCALYLSNCSAPTSAFLGPIFTGAKTGSVQQASLSYGTNRVLDKIRKEALVNNFKKINDFMPESSNKNRKPTILISYKISKVEISDVKEPEPLP
tara:strand:+ start:349 stop:657 length:309 start_codon:yes stop_codon:yes gene_type:complete